MPVSPQLPRTPRRSRARVRAAANRTLIATPIASLLAAALAVGLAGCGGAAAAAGPTWTPQPAYTLEPVPVSPAAPAVGSNGPSASVPANPSSSPSGSSASATVDPLVVAKKLTAPTGIAPLPDGTALVGQRNGTVVQVPPVANQATKRVRTLPGIDASGDGGLLDLALSPSFADDNLIYAYITTATDNRVVDFTLTGPVTPVFTGIPKGASGNAGRLAFGVDGNLYITTGDAGRPALAQDLSSLAGKVLEITSVGQPADGRSAIVASGIQNGAGICVDPTSGAVFETEAGTAADDINLLKAGADYGWPTPSATSVHPLGNLPTKSDGTPAGASDCAIVDGVLYVSTRAGTELFSATVDDATKGAPPTLGKFGPPTLTGKYGQLRTVVESEDGSIWLATANLGVTPRPTGATSDDERILHLTPSGGGASSQA